MADKDLHATHFLTYKILSLLTYQHLDGTYIDLKASAVAAGAGPSMMLLLFLLLLALS